MGDSKFNSHFLICKIDKFSDSDNVKRIIFLFLKNCIVKSVVGRSSSTGRECSRSILFIIKRIKNPKLLGSEIE